MKKLLYLLIVLLIGACQKTDSDTVAPEYKDWYILRSPVDRAIEGVWGDRDKTLLISTMFSIFRSTDQGRNWQKVHQQSIGMFGVVQYKDTLFTMNGLAGYRALTNADNYSVDDGKSWKRYAKYNPVFENRPNPAATSQFPINPITASNGTTYRINQVFLDGPNATTGLSETPGVITADKRRIDLPQLHQLNSLYLDPKERLYIVGSDAVCGRGQNFSFCNSQEGRGVVYISKTVLP